MKNILIVFVCIVMLGACNKKEKTTFEFLYPVSETRKVDLEFRDERITLKFACIVRRGICPFMGRGVSVYSLVESRETLGCKVSRKSMAF